MGGILVLGGTGNIGTCLTEELVTRGLQFTLGVRGPERMAELKSRGLAVREADFTRPETLSRAMRGMDALFLLVPLVEELSVWTVSAIRAARQACVRHIVRVSGAGAGVDSSYDFGRLHGALDEAVRDSAIPYTLLRPSFFMQNFANYYAQMVRSGSIALPYGEARVALVDVRDVARAAAEALAEPAEHTRRVYTLTGPEALTMQDVAARLSTELERSVAFVPVGDAAVAEAMTKGGVPAWNISMMCSLAGFIRSGGASGTNKIVERVTGRQPNDFATFARDYRNSWL